MPEESHCAAAGSAPLRGLPGAMSRPRRLTGPQKSDAHPGRGRPRAAVGGNRVAKRGRGN